MNLDETPLRCAHCREWERLYVTNLQGVYLCLRCLKRAEELEGTT